jgi:hypothetical protein
LKRRKIDRGTQRQGQTDRHTLRGQHWVQTFIEMIKALEQNRERQRESKGGGQRDIKHATMSEDIHTNHSSQRQREGERLRDMERD